MYWGMKELFLNRIESVSVRSGDQYLFKVDGWYDCNDNEYVSNGSVYKDFYTG